MKILIVTDYNNRTGLGKTAWQLYQSLNQMGVTAHILHLVSEQGFADRPQEGFVIEAPRLGHKLFSWGVAVTCFFRRAVNDFLRRHSYDVVLLGNQGLSYLHRHIPSPKAIWVHDLFTLYPRVYGRCNVMCLYAAIYNRLMLSPLRQIRHVVTVSEFTAGDVRRFFGGRHDIVTIWNGCDVPAPAGNDKLDALRVRYGIAPARRIILHVSSGEPRKNLPTFYDIVRAMPEQQFVRIGPCQLSMPNLVCVPRADEDELNEWYQLASCLVFTSLLEGFGMPLWEAYKHGCKIVSSRVSDMPQIFAGDTNVHFVQDARNSKEYIAMLQRHLDDVFVPRTPLPGMTEQARLFVDWLRRLAPGQMQ